MSVIPRRGISEKPRCQDLGYESCLCLHQTVPHAELDSAFIYKPQQISGCKQIQGYSTNDVQLFTDISKTNEEDRGYCINLQSKKSVVKRSMVKNG